MQVREAMSDSCEFIHPDTTVTEAARKMRELDTGFVPIGAASKGKLEGVVTDRDIVVRTVAEGRDPDRMKIKDCATSRVLYCYEGDDLESAASQMGKLQVQRLIVLDNPEDMRLRGVISLGDIAERGDSATAGVALEGIKAA